jgi:D-glycero-alpha-D-manno-heptose-7-phosphate kinase
MNKSMKKILEREPIAASAPCRVDMGGTLDISTFYYPMRHLAPCTVNCALSMRTRVRLLPFRQGKVKVSSKGFRSATFKSDRTPFRHPLGLMFAVAAFFKADGIHVEISSGSPPRSALGGSSVAAVALTAALSELQHRCLGLPVLSRKHIALLAQGIEESVAGVPCGFQDQLAAVYGGVNRWNWQATVGASPFQRQVLIARRGLRHFQRHLLVAYCGVPHESRDINGRWVQHFLAGKNRDCWAEIADLTRRFAAAVSRGEIEEAAHFMNRETAVRRRLTPDVLDPTGVKLVNAARRSGCGARFTGAGGGGCLWAIGKTDAICRLRLIWQRILADQPDARLLESDIDSRGLAVESSGM